MYRNYLTPEYTSRKQHEAIYTAISAGFHSFTHSLIHAFIHPFISITVITQCRHTRKCVSHGHKEQTFLTGVTLNWSIYGKY